MKEDLRAFWRNEFASAALQGLLSSNAKECDGIDHLVRTCRITADALLLELERNPIPPKEA